MPSTPARPGASGAREDTAPDEARWGPSTTYRAKPRLRRSSTPPAREQLPRPTSPRPSGATAGPVAERRDDRRPARAHGAAGAPATAVGGRGEGPPSRAVQAPRPAGQSRRVRRRRAVAVVAVLLVLAVVVYPLLLVRSALGSVDRVDALGSSTAADTPGSTYLVVGSDSREGTDIGGSTPGARTDSVMLLHVPDGGGPSVLVSIPRDSYVAVPGYYETKINAAYSLGGAPLLVQTVEQATGLGVDDYVETGFEGFAGVVDALGGVEMCPPSAIEDPLADLDIPAGCQEMDGATALGYARTRYEDPTGDIGRGDRQRELLSAIADTGASPGLLLNPFRAFPTASAGGGALTVDESTGAWDLVTFARGMRGASGADGVSMSVPIASSERVTNSGQVVDWDPDAAGQLWEALRTDDTEAVRALAEAQESASS